MLTRDGTSSYFVNNQPVRRRDMQDMFLGTGLGPRAYAIIGQGTDQSDDRGAGPRSCACSSKKRPACRSYKERRRETENRLSDTRENLTRVEDILRELNSHLENSEAQAEVAREYRELQADGERKQHALWFLKESGARLERHKKAQEIDQAQNELEAAIAELRAGEAALESRRQAHYAASDLVHTAQGQLYEANAQVSRLEAEIRHVVGIPQPRPGAPRAIDPADRGMGRPADALHGADRPGRGRPCRGRCLNAQEARATG